MSEKSRAEITRVRTWLRELEGKYGLIELPDLVCDCERCSLPPTPRQRTPKPAPPKREPMRGADW